MCQITPTKVTRKSGTCPKCGKKYTKIQEYSFVGEYKNGKPVHTQVQDFIHDEIPHMVGRIPVTLVKSCILYDDERITEYENDTSII